MTHPLEELRTAALAEISAASDEQALDAVRIRYLGRSGTVSAWGEQMKSLSKEERPVVGKLHNEVRGAVNSALEAAGEKLRAVGEASALAEIDISLPGTPQIGTLHPSPKCWIAGSASSDGGFALAEVRTWRTNGIASMRSIPPDHPARNEQDTFYLPDGRLLNPHLDGADSRDGIRTAAASRDRAGAPRRDEVDATHSAQFHQIEGLYVDERVSVADLKGTLEYFLRELFGADTRCSTALFSVHRAEFRDRVIGRSKRREMD